MLFRSVVHFETEEHYSKFIALTGVKVFGGVNGSLTCWYPQQEQRDTGRFSDVAYADE